MGDRGTKSGIRKQREAARQRVAVLIATCNRPGLLAQRSLTAVQRQTRPPDFLVVVDDSDSPNQSDNRNIVNDLRLGGARIVYLTNTRTRGASGAWNSGLDWLRRHAGDPNGVFVAVLDDDDEWDSEHLACCETAVVTQGLDMVAPSILRITGDCSPRPQRPPPDLDPALFLVGNPHIQGSNLFVRLNALLEAGTFDESLASCTDRDLCIRLADLGWLRYAALERVTVRHFAETARPRLSSPTADPKRRGLSRFWNKWCGRMSSEQRAACLERARALFQWEPEVVIEEPARGGPWVPTRDATAAELAHADDLVLVVGVIADDDHAETAARLFGDLLELQTFEQICALDVVVLSNGESTGALTGVVADYRAQGLTVFVASQTGQREDAERGFFGQGFTRPSGRAPIGPARTMLQSYVSRVARQRPGAIAWILDDDSRLDNVTDGSPTPPFRDLLASLKRMHSLGVDVVLGTVSGDPPVPPGSSVRTQLVDLYHNLAWLQGLDAAENLPNRRAENRLARAAARDYYYDLSRRDTHHLEWPFWLTPAHSGERVDEAVLRMIDALPRVLAGQGVFRPLVLDASCDVVGSMRPSVQRGTNTFVFDCAAFEAFPNAAPTFAGDVLRRSDMVWALLNRYAGGRRIVSATLPIRHDRSGEPPVGLDLGRLIPDIRGYALYSALEDVLVRRRERRLRDGLGAEVPDDLQFRDGDLDLAVARFRKYLIERTAAFLMNCWRIRGIVRTIRGWLAGETIRDGLLGSAPQLRKSLDSLAGFLAQAETCFALDQVEAVVDRVLDVPPDEVRTFLRSLPALIQRHRHAAAPSPQGDEWFHTERLAAATSLAKRVAGATELRVLGTGGEGVVFAAGQSVLKVIDYAKRSMANGAREGVERLAKGTEHLVSLYRVTLPAAPGRRQVISYPFEPGEPFGGGRAGDIVQILRDCRTAGILTTNFHPKNLIVTAQGVRLIDYGSDIRPMSRDGFVSMVQRAWLTLRFADREDLSDLMRQAITNQFLPELEGWESLLAAVDPPTKREAVDDALLDVVREWSPATVLDFGCGHGRVAAMLAGNGATVVGFDPDGDDLTPRWDRLSTRDEQRLRWLTGDADEALGPLGEAFDVVVCSLVLCVIADESEYRKAIHAVACSLAPKGRFVILICNPAATHAGDSTMQRRIVPAASNGTNTVVWTKVLPSGRQRLDVHRDLAQVAADLAGAGLTVERTVATGGLSLGSFLPSSDFLFLLGSKGVTAPRLNGHRPVVRNSGPRIPASVPVLCFHRVLPKEQEDGVSRFQRTRGTVVDLEVFRQQIEEVQKSFTPVSLDQYVDWLEGIGSLPPNACLLTFDDGYRDFAQFALPVLAPKRFPSVLFATMTAASHEALLPVDALYSALDVAERKGRLGNEEMLDWLGGERKRRYLRADRLEQERLLAEAALDSGGLRPSDLYLSEAELKALPADLVALGGHGHRHELLDSKSLPGLRAELRRVRLWLERIHDGVLSRPLALAYPNGACDAEAVAAMIETGFAAGFTVKPWVRGSPGHRWTLHRACVPNRMDAISDLLAGKELRI